MINNVVLIGRIVSDLEIKELEGIKRTIVTIAVPRTFKNSEGKYETDFIPCTMHGLVADHTYEYCKKGDTIAVKGRIELIGKNIRIIGEKVSFLSSKKEDEE